MTRLKQTVFISSRIVVDHTIRNKTFVVMNTVVGHRTRNNALLFTAAQ